MALSIESAHVAVIEDNADNADLICSLLELDLGISRIDVWTTGNAFLAAWPTISLTTLVLLDLQLPQVDGYSVLEHLRRLPGGVAARVIAVSANVLAADVERARNAGFNGFLGKPLHVRRFPDQIRRILAGEAVWEPR